MSAPGRRSPRRDIRRARSFLLPGAPPSPRDEPESRPDPDRTCRRRLCAAFDPSRLSRAPRQCRRRCAGCRSSLDQNRARRRTVETFQSQRKAAELILARWRTPEVQSLDNDDLLVEQRAMRLVMSRVELLDREVVDTHQLDAERYEIFRAFRCEERVVAIKALLQKESGIAGADENTLVPLEIMLLEVARTYGHEAFAHGDENRRTDEAVERDLIDCLPIIEKMLCRVDVRAGVRAERDTRYVGSSALRYRLLRLDRNLRVSRIDESAASNGNRYVEYPGQPEARCLVAREGFQLTREDWTTRSRSAETSESQREKSSCPGTRNCNAPPCSLRLT